MARFKLFLLIPLWLLLLPLFIPFIVAKDTTIFINLLPRDYIDPRTAEGFICGIDKKIDPQHLISELNSPFILDFIDNTEDTSSDYKTRVFDVALLTKSGKVENMLDSLNCLFNNEEGLYLVFLAPPRAQCNGNSFEDAKEAGKDYYPVYINNNANFEEVIKKFESQADGLKAAFGGQYPKLCGTMTPMHDETAKSRKDTLSILFNFAYNPDQTRRININEEQSCRQKNETENAFVKSEMFENSENVGFQDKDARLFEFVGVFETQVVRKVSTKAGIVFLKTKLGESGNTADTNDVVPYEDLLVFPKGQNMTTLFITIKIDNEKEEDETFSIELVSSKETKTRLKRGATQSMQKTITVEIVEQPRIEELKDPNLLHLQVINNARLSSKDSNSIKDFYFQFEKLQRLPTTTLFLEIYEPGQTPVVNENDRMRAFYFPYKSGIPKTTNDIGWVDIPYNPLDNEPKFAFTGGMNGCAIIAMEKKNDNTMFRVFHLQSPSTRGSTQWNEYMDIIKKDNEVGNEIGSFAYEDYGIEDMTNMDFIQGTNFLYYGTDSKWWYVSQFNEYLGAMKQNHDSVKDLSDSIASQSRLKNLYMEENKLYNGRMRKVTTVEVFQGRAPGKTEE
eukprot:GFUD01070551.1.p1 GENE.GFUD01070551.1~~GFUD01070551.1.p1  ORF type:complete len:644 (-),score=135.53 GFUD01070551.1:260-2119(-)